MRSALPSRFNSSSSIRSPAASFIRPFISSFLDSMSPISRLLDRVSGCQMGTPRKHRLTGSGLGAGAIAQLRQAAGEQAGHVHLADPEPGGDLRLGHAPEEPEMDDHLLPFG